MKEYEPATAARRIYLYSAIISPLFSSQDEDSKWRKDFEAWEQVCGELADLIRPRELDSNLLIAVLLSRAPFSILPQLQSTAEEYEDRYELLKTRILTHLEQRRTFNGSEHSPMDIDAVNSYAGKQKETRSCYHCGKVGHLSKDCRAKPGGGSSSSSSGSKQISGTSGSSASSHKPSSTSSSSSTTKGVKGKGKEKGKGGGAGGAKGGKKGKKPRVHVVEENEYVEEADAHQEEEWEDWDEEETEANEIKATEIGEENADVWEY
jgi:hypothetical protein